MQPRWIERRRRRQAMAMQEPPSRKAKKNVEPLSIGNISLANALGIVNFRLS